MKLDIPDIDTPRLRLRAPCIDDFPVYHRFFADAEASHFYGGPMSEATAWRKLAADIGHWVLRGYGVWALEMKGEGRCVGTAGLVWPTGWPRPELTWWISQDAQRQGIATEASQAVIRWAYAHGWAQVQTHMKDENMAARNLVAKLGGSVIARETFPDGVERDVFLLPRP